MDPSENTEQSIDERLGERVKLLRLSRGVKQSELAARLGIAFQTMSKIERGDIPLTVSRLIEICDALNVPFTAMLGEHEGTIYDIDPEQVKRARAEVDLSQQALAERTGTVRQFISQLELGQTSLTLQQLIRLASALGRHPWTFVDPEFLELSAEERSLILARRRADGS